MDTNPFEQSNNRLFLVRLKNRLENVLEYFIADFNDEITRKRVVELFSEIIDSVAIHHIVK